MRSRHVAWWLALGVSLSPALARAQQAPAAAEDPTDVLMRQGVELRRQGRDAEALEVFRQAYARQHAPRARAQMGLAQQALGDWLAADTSLREALAATADSWIAHNQVALQQSLTAVGRQLGSLEVAGGTPGAEVFVNGQRIGVLPLSEPVRTLAATVTLEVRAPGYYPYVRDIAVAPAVPTRETVRLSPRPIGETGLGQLAPTPTTHRTPRNDGVRVGLGVAGIGAGGAILVGAVIANAVRESAAGRWNDDSQCLIGSQSRGDRCGGDLSTANTAEALAITGYVVGGALVVGGAVLLIVGHPREASASAVSCGSGPGTLGGSCTLRF